MTKPLMKKYCAWCGQYLSMVECAPGQINKISHGICESCFNKSIEEIECLITQIQPQNQAK